MSPTREYHVGVRRSVLAPVVAFSLLALPAAVLGGVSGQAKEAHSSESAHESGSHSNSSSSAGASAGSSADHTSPHHGNGGGGNSGSGTGHGGHGSNPSKPTGPKHNQNNSQQYVEYGPAMVYGVPVPYAVDYGDTDDSTSSDADDNDPDYQGGPTVFDRRGLGEDSYVPPVEDAAEPYQAQAEDYDRAGLEPQDPTVLVFKDGHTLEVGNYAIVGAILFDLTPGHPRRIALADLDVQATAKQNDDRGVIFQLPTAMQAN